MPKGTGGKGQARGAKSKRKKRQREKRKESNDATATCASHGTSQAKIARGTTSDHKEYSSNWKALAKQLGLDVRKKGVKRPRGEEKQPSGHKDTAKKLSSAVPKRSIRVGSDDRKWEGLSTGYEDMKDGEPEPKKRKTEVLTPSGSDTGPGKCVALDCEMVGTGPNGDFSMLARCSVVNHHGNILYDSYVAPMDTVTDYRTVYSGVRPQDLKGAPDLRTVQTKVSELLRGRILVGHALRNDLKALLLAHPRRDIRDTSRYQPFRRVSKGGTPSLKKLAAQLLGIEIQEHEHDSVEDARVAMKLYQLHKAEWEGVVRAREDRRVGRRTARDGGRGMNAFEKVKSRKEFGGKGGRRFRNKDRPEHKLSPTVGQSTVRDEPFSIMLFSDGM